MRKVACIVLGLGIVALFTGVSIAAEHPAHGVTPGQPMKEHPSVGEHPSDAGMLSAGEVIKGIKRHIDGITKANNGYFTVTDPAEKKDLRLKLVRIHEDKVSYIKKDDAYFACTDFIADDGKTMYDIDFWMKKGKDGSLEVYQTKIHKKDGKPRFTYKDDEIVPVE